MPPLRNHPSVKVGLASVLTAIHANIWILPDVPPEFLPVCCVKPYWVKVSWAAIFSFIGGDSGHQADPGQLPADLVHP